MPGYNEGTFRHDVRILSQRSSKDHVYPRPDFISLDQYLTSPVLPGLGIDTLGGSTEPFEGEITANFAVIHDIPTGRVTPFGPSLRGVTDFASHEAQPEATLLFLRGFASPQWLETVAERYGVSPELYRRHLQFKAFSVGNRNLYSSASLPSSSSRVFQLTISTICSRNVPGSPYEPEDLQQARQLESEGLGRYFQHLRSKAKVADSLVRKCLLLSKEEYVLEQTVTVEVGSPGQSWRAVVWLDSGKDLSKSVEGPWSRRPGTQAWETYFFPVIVHRADSTAPQSNALNASAALSPSNPDPSVTGQSSQVNNRQAIDWYTPQNICLLPFQYGSRLDKKVACQDTLYALSELFEFAASSELQFLNLLQSRIEHELSFVGRHNDGRQNAISLLNLRYIKTQLTSHAQRLAGTTCMLENRGCLDWQQAPADLKAEHAANMLLTDFKYLHQRAQALARECEQGVDTLVNSSILEESRQSTANALRVQKLTVIATLFIPLSFVCSVWGMNFTELGSGKQPVWMWFATATPVIGTTLLAYHSDVIINLMRKK